MLKYVTYEVSEKRYNEMRKNYLETGKLTPAEMLDLWEICGNALKSWYGQAYLYEKCRERELAAMANGKAWTPKDILEREG